MTKPIDRVIDALGNHGIQRSGDSGHQFVAFCPAHPDAEGNADRSLTIGIGNDGRVLFKCFRGCSTEAIVAALNMTLADLHDGPTGKLTVEEIATAKKLPVKFLQDICGIRNVDGKGVGIPYLGEDGKRLFGGLMRMRYEMGQRPRQPKGCGLQMYGQWRLKKARKEGCEDLVIVEGESDSWTLWFHGVCALGLPGATAGNKIEASHLQGFKRLWVWQEPGESGEQAVASVSKRLAKSRWNGEAKVIRSEAFKDPSALHIATPDKEAFAAAWSAILAAAAPLPPPGPARQEKKIVVPGVVGAIPERSVAVANTLPPGFYGLTDLGNAQRLVHHHGRDLRYVPKWKSWLVWNGRFWVNGSDAYVMQRAKETVRAIYVESGAAQDPGLRQRLAEHAISSESCRSIHAMVDLAKSESAVLTAHTDFDAHPWLLNCPGGTVDLKTGEMCQHRREDMLTAMCATGYEADAEAPQWLAFIDSIFAGQADLIGYVQRFLGYCLTGDVSTHMLPVFWGGGGNGKGTLLNTLMKVVGHDYTAAAATEMLLARKNDRHPVEIADLLGKRMVVCQETDDGCRLNESLVKWLTGGDRLKARRLYENLWEFNPTHKLILSTNYRPVVRGTDRGIWRRLRLVPFTETFVDDKEDATLPEKLLCEAEGILAWAVRGCLSWQCQGEEVPAQVRMATQEYREEEDVVQRFIRERCLTGRGMRVQASALYSVFSDWMERTGEGRLSQKKFGRRLTDLGYERIQNDTVWYESLALRDMPANSQTQQTYSGSSNGNGAAGSPFDLAWMDD